MTKRIKLVAIVLSVLMAATLVVSIGVTAAIWSTSGTGGNSEVGPSATSDNWNVWAKYFKRSSDGVLFGFDFTSEDVADTSTQVGFNHNRLIIPNSVDGDVTVISSGLFETSTMKEMAEELAIPSSVKTIRASAFAGFTNLKTVTLQLKPEAAGPGEYVIEPFAFAGTTDLAEVYVGDVPLSNLTPTLGDDGYLTFADASLPNTTIKISPLAFFNSGFVPKTV